MSINFNDIKTTITGENNIKQNENKQLVKTKEVTREEKVHLEENKENKKMISEKSKKTYNEIINEYNDKGNIKIPNIIFLDE